MDKTTSGEKRRGREGYGAQNEKDGIFGQVAFAPLTVSPIFLMQLLSHKDNNFDFLRIAAAFGVLVSHQFSLTGRPEPVMLGVSLGGFCVLVFFAISGFLVAGSWMHDPSAWRFAVRRLLRIWPGLLVACVLVVLVLGPMVSQLGLREYFASPLTWNYLSQLSFWEFKSQLPGVFAGNPISESANGSLWTIPFEIRCYLALMVVGVLGLMRRNFLLPLAFVVFAIWFFFLFKTGYDQPIRMQLQMGVVFFCAAAMYQLRALWQSRRPWIWLAAIAAILLLWHGGMPEIAYTLGVPVIAVLFGTGSLPVLKRAGRFGDVSYGLYIYAYPVQQTVIWLSDNRLPFGWGLGLATLITTILAWFSWKLIEQPALRLKNRL
ncbi:acyltransferase family protein [Ottowia sp. VDI28]|uniref:acyltransferase family protein n=1 Tax=Ottowia sp. VDI28 TaxID=3133968 RepID=UPI003C2EEABD